MQYISLATIEQFKLTVGMAIPISHCSNCGELGHINDMPFDKPCPACGQATITTSIGAVTARHLVNGDLILVPKCTTDMDEKITIAGKLKACIEWFGMDYVLQTILSPTAASTMGKDKWIDKYYYSNGTYANPMIDGNIELMYQVRERLIAIGYNSRPNEAADVTIKQLISAAFD